MNTNINNVSQMKVNDDSTMGSCLIYQNKDVLNMINRTIFDVRTKKIFFDFLTTIGDEPIDGLFELLCCTPGIFINELDNESLPYYLYEMNLNLFSNYPSEACFYWESENLDIIPDDLYSLINEVSSDPLRESSVAELIRYVIYELIWSITTPIRKTLDDDKCVSLLFMYVPREFINFSPPVKGYLE